MFLDGLKNILLDVPKFSEGLLGKTVGSLDQVNRIDRECHECESTKPLDDLFTGIDENTATSYYQWETCEDGRVCVQYQEAICRAQIPQAKFANGRSDHS